MIITCTSMEMQRTKALALSRSDYLRSILCKKLALSQNAQMRLVDETEQFHWLRKETTYFIHISIFNINGQCHRCCYAIFFVMNTSHGIPCTLYFLLINMKTFIILLQLLYLLYLWKYEYFFNSIVCIAWIQNL